MLRLDKVIKPWKESAALNDHINLYGFWNETAFLTKSGDVGMVLSVPGVDYESLDHAQQEYAVKRLEAALKAFGPGFHVYQYLFKSNRPEIPFASYDDPVVNAATEQRRQFFEAKRDHLYQVEIFYVIVLEGPRSKSGVGAAFARLFRDPAGAIGELRTQFTNNSMKVLLRSQIENELVRLEQKVQAFSRQLADFMQIEVLGQQEQFRFFRRWLGSLDDLSNGTRARIKGIMSDVFQHAIRYGWLNDGENPIFAVRQSTKRERVTEPLEAWEFRALMVKLPQKMRVIGIVAATTGLRISEVLGLKWMDIDWKTLQMNVTRSVVDGIIGKCKTETSRKPVPIDSFTAGELAAWKKETCYAGPDDWVFASERAGGRMPPWSDTLLDRILQPAAKKAGITKWVGFHTFRHTYSTLLKANNEDVKVVQELMRHANISTTMNIYTKALTPAKREAQSRVVDVLIDRSRNVVEGAAESAA